VSEASIKTIRKLDAPPERFAFGSALLLQDQPSGRQFKVLSVVVDGRMHARCIRFLVILGCYQSLRMLIHAAVLASERKDYVLKKGAT
jgi:hypothetical protein